MLFRRARPTLRVLREDLVDGWGDPRPRRWLAAGNTAALHPLSGLDHPIIAKASASFGEEPAEDTFVGPIASAQSVDLLEIKASQWRAGVWKSEDDFCWVVVAGLAKGSHEDRDDFYQRVARLEAQGMLAGMRPTTEDLVLWKREVASDRLSTWELTIQSDVGIALGKIHAGGRHVIKARHPLEGALEEANRELADIEIEVVPVREEDYEADEIVVSVRASRRWLGTSIVSTLADRVLISVNPPEQSWDRYADTYSNIAEPGSYRRRYDELRALTDSGRLAESEPGREAHRAHRRGLTERTVEGRAVRALCGAYFVPRQDHGSMSECETCSMRLADLERAVH